MMTLDSKWRMATTQGRGESQTAFRRMALGRCEPSSPPFGWGRVFVLVHYDYRPSNMHGRGGWGVMDGGGVDDDGRVYQQQV